MLYIVSMSFQIAGAIILLWSSLQKKIEEQICRIYFEKETGSIVDENGMITLDKEKVKDIAKSIILNRCAFVNLILGYAANFFVEETTVHNLDTVIGIIALTFIIMCVGCGISEEMSKTQAEKNMKVHATNSWGALLLYNVKPQDNNIDKTDKICMLSKDIDVVLQ